MSQVLRLSGLEDDGLLTGAALAEYNRLQTNAAKRSYLVRLVRSGYALDEMGLSPVIELLQTTDGKKFLKMSERERLQRLLTMISALLGESAGVPVAAAPSAPAAVQSAPAAEQAMPESVAPPAAEALPAEPVATASEPEQPVAAPARSTSESSDEDDKPQAWGGPSMAKAGKARNLLQASKKNAG
ncbi:hypothetical protein RM153_23420 (plasmid) [Pantoea agglomerans]|jgi:hypothetical protein|uniref:hypothetical protein n=1 Tax=Enterobacter agglomerans TaxID=549 RepID=UPI002899D54F|nr:hypothetical protein [Pantoea agglomerans]WNK51585.1 hypothetical protein RM153_23420 [Pantoea agglomerans]